MKRLRRSQAAWYVPPPPPAVAVFACRGCRAPLTGPLRLVDDPTTLGVKDLTPLVPPGRYWPVAEVPPPGGAAGSGEMVPADFAGCFAVGAADLLPAVGRHPDRGRWQGCCGPSGNGGPNRVCGCGREVGTERADCMWPLAVYLEPASVRVVAPDAAPGTSLEGK